jgi:hypothetical protein
VAGSRDTRSLLRVLLELFGHQVEEAADGRGAVEKALTWGPEVALSNRR